jgi:hypothetical protein
MALLAGIRVVELAGIKPGLFCAVMSSGKGPQLMPIDRLKQKAGAHRATLQPHSRRHPVGCSNG